MSHFSVLVIGGDIEKQLAPYHEFECTGVDDEYVVNQDFTEEVRARIASGETITQALGYYGLDDKIVHDESRVNLKKDHKYGYAVLSGHELVKAVNRTNPNRKWDWWQLGGRYTGRLQLKNGAGGTTGKPGLMTDAARPGRVDQAAKAAIDFDAMRDEAEGKARATYRRFFRLLGDREFPKTWARVREEHGDNIDAARSAYHAQPGIVAVKEDDEFLWSDDIAAEFGCTEDEYAKRARNRACGAFAVVKDSQWYERGRMGWFACVSDEKDEDQWYAEVAKLLDEAPEHALISIVDCHI